MLDESKRLKARTIPELEALAKERRLEGWCDVPDDVYHKGPGISRSGLLQMLKSPKKYMHCRRNPDDPSEAMEFGTAVHMAVLEPDRFSDQYAVKPLGTDRRTKAGKESYEAFEKANAGKTIMHHEEHAKVRGLADAMRSHDVFSKMLAKGLPELSFYGNGPISTVCRARPDLYIPSTGTIVDVKTTQDCDEDAFKWSVERYGYDVQAAYYLDVLTQAGFKAETFVIAAVEKSPPFEMELYSLDHSFIDQGREKAMRALILYAQCLAEDSWPGRPPAIKNLAAPRWRNNITWED